MTTLHNNAAAPRIIVCATGQRPALDMTKVAAGCCAPTALRATATEASTSAVTASGCPGPSRQQREVASAAPE